METEIQKVKWEWLIVTGICSILFIISLPIGIQSGQGYDMYGIILPNWWMLTTILSLGGFFISAFLFIKELYL